MSSNLPIVNIAGAITGQTYNLDFSQFYKTSGPNPSTADLAHIRIYNESGCGIGAVFNSSGRSEFIPAGAWPAFELAYNDNSITFTIVYTLPNPPVSIINAVYYAPGENVPDTPQLGNSPIGIGGSVSTAGVQTLSNEGNALGTLVIDTGPTSVADALAIYNDHFLWQVVQSGTAHQVLKGQTSGNPLQIGQSGDISEVLGSLTVDSNISTNGTVFTNTVQSNGASDLVLDVATGQKFNFEINAASIMQLLSTGIQPQAGKKYLSQSGHTLQDWNFGFSAVVTTGTSITHGIKANGVAATPTAVFVAANSNFTAFISSVGTTTFTITPTANGNAWWIAVLA